MTDIEKFEAAFSRLESEGIVARMNYQCCNGCATAQLGADYGDDVRWVFWHQQEDESVFGADYDTDDDGELIDYLGREHEHMQCSLHLGHGPDERTARQIIAALEEQGFTVEWDGDMMSKIEVHP